ncbi:MAG: hypothetical protein ACP5E5_02240 [Acidobacteriaceae bacterium]
MLRAADALFSAYKKIESGEKKKCVPMRARLIGSGDGPELVPGSKRARREGRATGVVVLH